MGVPLEAGKLDEAPVVCRMMYGTRLAAVAARLGGGSGVSRGE